MGQLFWEGVTERLWPYVQAVPELAAAYPPPFSSDDAAATHHHLFAFNLFPYESIFLDSSGLLGGDVSQAVAHVYDEMAFAVDAAAASPDHLGHELLCMAYLTGAEAQVWEQNQPEQVIVWQQRQRYFLEAHLLRWLTPFSLALQRLQEPFYHHLVQLVLALVTDHYARLVTGSDPDHVLLAFGFPDETLSLTDTRTSLRHISHYLLTPRQSGLYLTRRDIEQLSRSLDLPRGFGKRDEMMRNVWDAAAQYNQVIPLLYALKKLVNEWQLAYATLNDPVLAPFIHPWQERLRHTQLLLTELGLKVSQEMA